jgi:adenylate kinase
VPEASSSPTPRVVALTGVPGTGKTAAAAHLDDDLPVVAARELAERADAVEGRDEERDADVVDHARLAERAREVLPDGPVLVEGVLAHHADPDGVVLLRCHPDELRARLEGRDWPPQKVDENVMAETLDALVPEVDADPAWEIDTTDRTAEDVADEVRRLLDGEAEAPPPGTVDWTDTLVGEPA